MWNTCQICRHRRDGTVEQMCALMAGGPEASATVHPSALSRDDVEAEGLRPKNKCTKFLFEEYITYLFRLGGSAN
jgi:hypothetical protein